MTCLLPNLGIGKTDNIVQQRCFGVEKKVNNTFWFIVFTDSTIHCYFKFTQIIAYLHCHYFKQLERYITNFLTFCFIFNYCRHADFGNKSQIPEIVDKMTVVSFDNCIRPNGILALISIYFRCQQMSCCDACSQNGIRSAIKLYNGNIPKRAK